MNAARKCFELIDKDGGGTLSTAEIVEAVKSDEEVIKFLRNCGEENLQFLLQPARLKKALEVLDEDGSGEIDIDECAARRLSLFIRSTRRPLDGVAAWVVRPTHRSISTQVRRLAREGAVRPPPRDPGRRRGGRLPVQSRGGLRRRVPGRGRGPAAGAARVAGQRRRRAGPCPPVHRAERGLLKKGRATSTSITAAPWGPRGGLAAAPPTRCAKGGRRGGVDASNSAA